MIKELSTLKDITRKDLLLFLLFYFGSTLIYYTASWISWGAFAPGHPPYFHVCEFFASGGAQFTISFLITIPIWFITSIILKPYKLKFRLLSHIIFLPVYVFSCYFLLLWVKSIFGWAMNWDGYNTIWTLYIYMLFYLVQFGFIHAYTYLKNYRREQKEKATLRETTLKSEITALKSQLNPHFLHNLFNSINATIPPENENTRELIIQLSDLFRYQNYASQNETVTIKEELNFIKNYLELMKLRLKERLIFSFEIEKDLLSNSLPPMLLQPLVENAITHGISPKIEPSTLKVIVKRIEGRVKYSIEDTGVGIQNKEAIFSKGLGLSNTKMRLQKIFGTALKIEDNKPSGTKISFII